MRSVGPVCGAACVRPASFVAPDAMDSFPFNIGTGVCVCVCVCVSAACLRCVHVARIRVSWQRPMLNAYSQKCLWLQVFLLGLARVFVCLFVCL